MAWDISADAILFQDCQFLVYKAIDIESTKVHEIRMANCFVSFMAGYPGYNSYRVIYSHTKGFAQSLECNSLH